MQRKITWKSMNILVCISKTPDTTSKVSFDGSGQHYIEDGVQFIMNPYDEWYALVRALELKEQFGGQVDVIHVGPATSEMIIRKALAIGADAAYRVDAVAKDAYFTACQISDYAKKKNYDILFVGKETIDHNGSEVGSFIAAMLDLPFVSYTTKLSINDQLVQATNEIEGGIEVVEVSLPIVVSAAKGLAEQRIPNMKGIMDAKKKPLEIIPAVDVNTNIELVRFELPPNKSSVRMIDPNNINELLSVFSDDLKII